MVYSAPGVKAMVLQLVISTLTSLCALPAGASDGASREEEGDGWRARSEPAYRRALAAWEVAERFAGRIDDRSATARAVRERAGLLVLNLDGRGYSKLEEDRGRTVTLAPLPAAVAFTAAVVPGAPTDEDLRALATLLSQAGRTYLMSADKEPRELPLLFEAVAIAEKLAGDADQARADAAYRLALEGACNSTDRSSAARIRFKLRDFAGARAALAAARLVPESLPAREKVELVRLQRDLARFGGSRAEALAFERKLIELGQKAEEVPLPSMKLWGFLRGAPADLARAARTLLASSSTLSLTARERLIAIYLASQALVETGDLTSAEEALRGALVPVRSGGRPAPPVAEDDPWLRGGLWARLAEARDRAGDYEGAVEAYRRSTESLSGLSGTERARGRLSLDAAAALFGLGQREDARRAALALIADEALPADLRLRARLLLAGILYAGTEESEAALEDVLTTLSLAERERQEAKLGETASNEVRAFILAHKGNALRRKARFAEARGEAARSLAQAFRVEAMLCARQAAEIAGARPGLERLQACATANLAELQLEAADRAAARRSLSAALSLAQGHHAFETEWRVHWYLARLALAEGDRDTARGSLEQSARIIEEHRSRILDSDRKAGFMASKAGMYELMAEEALDRNDGPAAFAAAERSRARAFVESLGLRLLLFGADRDRALHREYLGLLSRADEQARGGGALYGVRAAGSYDDLRSSLDLLKKRIRATPSISPVVRALVEGEAAKADGVQRDLLPGERLVEYFGAGERLVAFVLGAESFGVVRLPGRRADILAAARLFAEGKATDRSLAERLGRELLEPILPLLDQGSPSTRALMVVPFGDLHRLPFEALVVEGRYLIERAAVSYLPSATVLRYLNRVAPSQRPTTMLALVDPSTDYDGDGKQNLPVLNGAREEVEALIPLFPSAKVLSGADATEAACSRLAAGKEVIHLACHGEFVLTRPLDSRLYLSPGGESDGLLRASEIYGIDLRGSRLVVLSGCETARASVGAGEDPVGIGMAFLHTGASALLASLWKVEDRSTATLMKTFYSKWLARPDGSRTLALREAKLDLLRDGQTAAPSRWASFILVGAR